jgi:hypothetical protein
MAGSQFDSSEMEIKFQLARRFLSELIIKQKKKSDGKGKHQQAKVQHHHMLMLRMLLSKFAFKWVKSASLQIAQRQFS